MDAVYLFVWSLPVNRLFLTVFTVGYPQSSVLFMASNGIAYPLVG